MIDYNTLSTLGFDRNPLVGIYQTADQTRIGHAVRMAVTDKSLLVVSGRRGMGKTTAVSRALSAMAKDGGLAIIQPNRVEVEQIRAGDLLVSAILDLSDERPKQQREPRFRQAARIIGIGSTKKSVVLLIEEAHSLSYHTILTLKRLREVSYQGVFPLLSIILVGQRNPLLYSRALDEVRLRSMSVDMQGITAQEATEIIQTAVGKVFEPDAVRFAAQSTPVWIDLQNILACAMTHAVAMARQTVTVEDVRIAAREIDPTSSAATISNLGEVAKSLGIGTKTLAEKAGVTESQAMHALAGRAVNPEARTRLANYLESELGKSKAA